MPLKFDSELSQSPAHVVCTPLVSKVFSRFDDICCINLDLTSWRLEKIAALGLVKIQPVLPYYGIAV